jgi:MoaA/NifB/PqqE/SkfB family radical SAM enzyme
MIEKISTLELFDGSLATIKDTESYKVLRSENYNFFFNKKDGFFVRWGKGDDVKTNKATKQEIEIYTIWCTVWQEKFDINQFLSDLKTDGSLENTAPEILDWEISEKCDMGCTFCYKSNVAFKGKNISFEDFKETFHKLPQSITTIAFGIGSIHLFPELWDILTYTREHGVIPTITINGVASESDLDKLAKLCGAVAVSVYDKEKSYNCVKGLTDRGLQQTNIHFMISEETYDKALEVLSDIKTDPRLEKLRALVMLSLKEKGRSVGKFHSLSQEKFDTLFQYAIDNEIGCGFDSCSAAKAFNFINKNSKYEYMRQYIEPCEAGGVYSAYINVNSEYFPCSFSEGEGDWNIGLKIENDFMKDIWFNEKTKKFAESVKKCRKCNVGCSIFEV